MQTALITGSAGFIGYHLAARLLAAGWRVIGLDCLSPYYDVTLKQRRHAMLAQTPGFTPVIGKLEDPGRLMGLFEDRQPDAVIHLAAQAGVRHSIDAPRDYLEANLIGTFELLEAARAHPPVHLLMASTSSVYGANTEMPFDERQKADTPMSFYAATKKAGEAMSHSYAHLWDLPTTMFRFFTVYGPWGRPDLAFYKFADAILEPDHDRRPVRRLFQTRGDDAHHARVPARARGPDQRRVKPAGFGLFHRLQANLCFDLAAVVVELGQLVGDGFGFMGVIGRE